MTEPQITGGGGHEPDPDHEPRADVTSPDPRGSVDLKSIDLPEPD